MDSWQVARQIKYMIETRKWEDNASYQAVFGATRIAFSPPELLIQELRFPCVVIVVQGADIDEEEPQLIRQSYELRLLNMVRGDHVGEDAVIGSNRPTVQQSQGRGILEIEEELLATLRKMTTHSGIKIIVRSRSNGNIDELGDSGYIVSRNLAIDSFCTDERFYHPAMRFIATAVANSVQLSWQLPPDRFDRREVRLQRALGTTPPPTVNDGTNITLSALLATSVTDSGLSYNTTYSYSLFGGYDEWQTSNSTRWSERISRTVTTPAPP